MDDYHIRYQRIFESQVIIMARTGDGSVATDAFKLPCFVRYRSFDTVNKVGLLYLRIQESYAAKSEISIYVYAFFGRYNLVTSLGGNAS